MDKRIIVILFIMFAGFAVGTGCAVLFNSFPGAYTDWELVGGVDNFRIYTRQERGEHIVITYNVTNHVAVVVVYEHKGYRVAQPFLAKDLKQMKWWAEKFYFEE